MLIGKRIDYAQQGASGQPWACGSRAAPHVKKALTASGLLPLDLDNLVGLGAAGRHHLYLHALLFADQGSSERRGDGDLALFGIGLRLADNLPYRLFVGVLIDQSDGRAKGKGLAGKLRHINNFGARQLVLKLGDAAFIERLRFLGGVIFSIFRQVAVRARVGNLLDDARPLDLLAMLEFGLKRRVSGRGHRNLIHWPQTSSLIETKFRSRTEAPSGLATKNLSL